MLASKSTVFSSTFSQKPCHSWNLLRNMLSFYGWAGTYGAFQGQAPPPISSDLVLLWNTQITVSDAHFLSYFTHAITSTKWRKLMMIKYPLDDHGVPKPQTCWCLRTDNVTPWDTTLFPHHQPIRQLCMSWSHALHFPSLPLPLNASLKPITEFRSFKH